MAENASFNLMQKIEIKRRKFKLSTESRESTSKQNGRQVGRKLNVLIRVLRWLLKQKHPKKHTQLAKGLELLIF